MTASLWGVQECVQVIHRGLTAQMWLKDGLELPVQESVG